MGKKAYGIIFRDREGNVHVHGGKTHIEKYLKQRDICGSNGSSVLYDGFNLNAEKSAVILDLAGKSNSREGKEGLSENDLEKGLRKLVALEKTRLKDLKELG